MLAKPDAKRAMVLRRKTSHCKLFDIWVRHWKAINVGTRNQAQQFLRELDAAKLQ